AAVAAERRAGGAEDGSQWGGGGCRSSMEIRDDSGGVEGASSTLNNSGVKPS
ncbi:unnamed protein product, partial [Ectocarpus sp. 13 AM-2016]